MRQHFRQFSFREDWLLPEKTWQSGAWRYWASLPVGISARGASDSCPERRPFRPLSFSISCHPTTNGCPWGTSARPLWCRSPFWVAPPLLRQPSRLPILGSSSFGHASCRPKELRLCWTEESWASQRSFWENAVQQKMPILWWSCPQWDHQTSLSCKLKALFIKMSYLLRLNLALLFGDFWLLGRWRWVPGTLLFFKDLLWVIIWMAVLPDRWEDFILAAKRAHLYIALHNVLKEQFKMLLNQVLRCQMKDMCTSKHCRQTRKGNNQN